ARVWNNGTATANTGFNAATGSGSLNLATTDQDADIDDGDGISVPGNFGTANNHSDGSASVSTGAATATGNASSTDVGQSVALGGATIAFVDQDTGVVNRGTAGANTGGNTATGNGSSGIASTDQSASVDADTDADPVVAANFGEATNHSDGWAGVTTGAAAATGNDSDETTSVSQSVSGDAAIALVDQEAGVRNRGSATASTGGNVAVGNASFKNAYTTQMSDVDAGASASSVVASNDGIASNDSNGSASVDTGDAWATGNAATTWVSQDADLSTPDDGFALIDQEAWVRNVGRADASTGNNLALGNVSSNLAYTEQHAHVDVDPQRRFTADDVVVANDASAANTSDGSADIWTGSASATGNSSTTDVTQAAAVALGDDGFVLVDQDSDVLNAGSASADTGNNFAQGNGSFNIADTEQHARGPAVASLFGRARITVDDLAITNNADTSNSSDGSAAIGTGGAWATGNDSGESTTVVQSVNAGIGGDGFVIGDQTSSVVNFGAASADTGSNIAFGNVSLNDAATNQTNAGVTADSVFANASVNATDVAVVNNAATSNTSDGSASITTGAASATGNASDTSVTQELNAGISGDGFVLSDQDSAVFNVGFADADTGDNLAFGNASYNDADTSQRARVRAGSVFGDASVAAEDIAVTNSADTSNDSDGSAAITTGDAFAAGNDSATDVTQVVNGGIGGDGFVLSDQDNYVVNYGDAEAHSGGNTATGNLSSNFANTVQHGAVRATSLYGDASLAAEDLAVTNNATTANTSDGSAEITTGCAEATGNASTTDVTQFVNGGISGDGFVLSDQDSDVVNLGTADADSGGNSATGNASFNDADTDQRARVRVASVFGRARIDADTVAVVNNGETSNDSNGSASITTGPAIATGNESTTDVTQAVNAGIGGDGFV
ncbi:MAG: hypothetical protein LC708_02155, partial [Actinobacteria bacterium]|nr:hypothetical protein [Actinomycetota bacterium]